MKYSILAVFALLLLCSAAPQDNAEVEGKKGLQRTLQDLDLVGQWIYDDIPLAFKRANQQKKPILIVFR